MEGACDLVLTNRPSPTHRESNREARNEPIVADVCIYYVYTHICHMFHGVWRALHGVIYILQELAENGDAQISAITYHGKPSEVRVPIVCKNLIERFTPTKGNLPTNIEYGCSNVAEDIKWRVVEASSNIQLALGALHRRHDVPSVV